jgi:gamma-glutamylcyclotransferase (GGCT)/AIG2-like uncharacterized protein YtfP
VSPAYLFVYGTLRRGSPNRFARLLESQARFAGSGRMLGRLYDLGNHPGAVSSKAQGEWVRGDVFLLKRPTTTLPILDRYEGSEYERRMVPVHLASEKHIEAQVYFLKREPAGGRIQSGEWKR